MKNEIQYNGKYVVVTANDLIKGKQKMTIQESRLLYIAISQVIKEDRDFKTYTTTIPELAEFLRTDVKDLYRDIEKICTSLLQRIVKIRTGKNKWTAFQWVNCAKYDNGTLTIRLSDDIKPYLLELERHYSQYLLSDLISFRSYYASRIYQLLVCEMKGKEEIEVTMTVEELREFLQIEKGKLERTFDLIKKTIEVAKNEINSYDTNYILVMDYNINRRRTKGNPITSITITACRK